MTDDTEEPDEASLDKLSQAFAAAMSRNAAQEPPTEDAVVEETAEVETLPSEPEETPVVEQPVEEAAEDACPISPKTIVEAILFVGHPENEPIPATAMARLLRGVGDDEIAGIVDELNEDYDATDMPFRVAADGEGFGLRLREEFEEVREHFYGKLRQVRLSQLAIDVLAIVAYNQPVTREEVDKLLNNGVPSGRVLNQLVRRDLLTRQTNEENQKRKEFVTTPRFLELFDLRDLGDLPQSEDPE